MTWAFDLLWIAVGFAAIVEGILIPGWPGIFGAAAGGALIGNHLAHFALVRARGYR